MASASPDERRKNRRFVLKVSGMVIGGIILCFAIFIGIWYYSWMRLYRNKVNLKTPFDYPNSTWISEEPYIYLHIPDDAKDYSGEECYIQFNGERIESHFLVNYPSPSEFQRVAEPGTLHSEIWLLIGTCDFKEDKVTMKVTADNLFDGEYKRIVLERVEND